MKSVVLHLALFVASLSGAVVFSAEEPPSTLEQFCTTNGIDTPANCRCGQQTAEGLLTPEEMRVALEFFRGNRSAADRLGADAEAFMDKLAQITKGCT